MIIISAAKTISANASTYRRLRVRESASLITSEPLIHSGVTTVRFWGEITVRTNCCRMRLIPKVASRVSSGRPLRNWITLRSMMMPAVAATRKPAGMERINARPGWPGSSCCMPQVV